MTVPWSPWGSTLLPGHSCPRPRDKTKVAFCGVGRAEDVATSDRAAGQPPAPSPADAPSPVPPEPLQCHISCASLTPAPCHGATGMLLLPPELSSAQTGTRTGRGRAGVQGGLPAPSTPPAQVAVPVRSPGGHLRVGDLGGFLGQAAALCRDQVVVLGHVLVRVVQAAGTGPGWGPRGQPGGVISVCPLCSGLGRLGTTPAHPQAQGTPLSSANPLPKTLVPGTFGGTLGRAGSLSRDPHSPHAVMGQGWTQ